MAFKETTIATRLLGGFATVLALTLVLGVVSIRWMKGLAETTSIILDHPFTISVAIANLRAEILTNQIALMQLARSSDPEAIQRLTATIVEHRAQADRELATVRERYLGESQDVERVVKALERYRAVGNQAIAMARAGKQGNAIDLVENQATPLVALALREEELVATASADRAARFKREAVLQAGAAVRTTLVGFLLIAALSILIATLITRSIAAALKVASRTVSGLVEHSQAKGLAIEAVAAGDLSAEIPPTEPLRLDLARLPKDDLGALMKGVVGLSEIQASVDASFLKMTGSLRRAREDSQTNQWLKTGLGQMDSLMRGEQHFGQLAGSVLEFLAEYLGAGAGAMFVFREQDQDLELLATYATAARERAGKPIKLGEGLIGQAAKEFRMISLTEIPPDYLAIESALGAGTPAMVVAVPFAHDGKLIGALELATFKPFNATELAFLKQAMEILAIGLQVNLSRQRVNELLSQSQTQEEELRVQQEELQQTNEELEERSHLLEQQREQIQAKSLEVARGSTYKSEFLANMSHELRTPLNSLMILSGILRENKGGNLTDKQVEYAATINGAGKDLLDLINDILDLSKIEAGHLEFTLEQVRLGDLLAKVGHSFQSLADQKGLSFSTGFADGTPQVFCTDFQRCNQILKNLVSNALKFTHQGSVSLRAYLPEPEENPLQVPAMAFAVADTGIGIPGEKHETVFQAFQQADGTTSRKYGGTGLGLSISRQLARGLQGELLLSSQDGAGTVATLYLPVVREKSVVPRLVLAPPLPAHVPQAGPGDPLPPAPVPDDRDDLEPGDRTILVIEDDLNFGKGLLVLVRERGFKALAAADGLSGLILAEALQPSAIILDVMLPELDGWGVMQQLAVNPRTRHIPVHFLSCLEGRQKAMTMGAIGFVTKPATSEDLDALLGTIEAAVAHRVKRLLIVEDDLSEAQSLVALLQDREIEIQVAGTGSDAIGLLSAEAFDCIVLDLGLSDMSGFDLLAHIQKLDEKRRIPVIIHSGRELSREDESRLQRYAESIIIKGAKSPERLLNEVTLFLHVVETSLAPGKQRMIRSTMDGEALFAGKKVLIVDDDMRNVFSLSSLLADREMTILEAENGKEALVRLDEHPDTRIVLMDIMMPEMDGYEAIRTLREDPRFTRLPVIALTAKAMKGDREACMKAGASDYISKPIDPDRLLSLLRVWLYQ